MMQQTNANFRRDKSVTECDKNVTSRNYVATRLNLKKCNITRATQTGLFLKGFNVVLNAKCHHKFN